MKMLLASYATVLGVDSKRRYKEKEHEYRNEFQRDRDRVIHSKAFRQLESKTQVFINGLHDRIRTRLTHTIEVAAIARTLARALAVNEDLVETIALAHDLGHPPFGHGGEVVLNELMHKCGGFEHNRHSLKVVDELEVKYPGFLGLNLTWGTRSGLVKHRDTASELDGILLPRFGSVEAQIADVADDLTYLSHDIDDGLALGLLTLEQLRENVVWNLAEEKARSEGAVLGSLSYIPYCVRCFIDNAVANVVTEGICRLKDISKVDEVYNAKESTVRFSASFSQEMRNMKKFMYENLYYASSVKEVTKEHANMLRTLFEFFCKKPAMLKGIYAEQSKTGNIELVVGEYIASLNDREAKRFYLELKNS